jgi:hypothetical protein
LLDRGKEGTGAASGQALPPAAMVSFRRCSAARERPGCRRSWALVRDDHRQGRCEVVDAVWAGRRAAVGQDAARRGRMDNPAGRKGPPGRPAPSGVYPTRGAGKRSSTRGGETRTGGAERRPPPDQRQVSGVDRSRRASSRVIVGIAGVRRPGAQEGKTHGGCELVSPAHIVATSACDRGERSYARRGGEKTSVLPGFPGHRRVG